MGGYHTSQVFAPLKPERLPMSSDSRTSSEHPGTSFASLGTPSAAVGTPGLQWRVDMASIRAAAPPHRRPGAAPWYRLCSAEFQTRSHL